MFVELPKPVQMEVLLYLQTNNFQAAKRLIADWDNKNKQTQQNRENKKSTTTSC